MTTRDNHFQHLSEKTLVEFVISHVMMWGEEEYSAAGHGITLKECIYANMTSLIQNLEEENDRLFNT